LNGEDDYLTATFVRLVTSTVESYQDSPFFEGLSMSKPLGIQLYTVREALAQDFTGTIERIAAIGYAAVETAGFPGSTPAEADALFRRLGLQAPSAHSPLPLGDKRNEVLETMAALGAKYLVLAHIPTEEFKTIDGIKRACDRLNEANVVARENGLTLLYHNHWWEYEQAEFGRPYRVMAEHLEPSIGFELDAYWAKTGGCDPVEVLRELGARVPLMHVKDGSAKREDPQTAVGEGILDYTAIIPAAQHVEYQIVELDHCATDMMQAVEKSYRYLTEKGLAHGR
jgi:sugar phosphate isomerase/epimerase